MLIYIPIVVYGLQLFTVSLRELHCLPNYLHVSIISGIGFYHFTKFRCSTPSVSEIANILPEGVYCKKCIFYYNVYHKYFGMFIAVSS